MDSGSSGPSADGVAGREAEEGAAEAVVGRHTGILRARSSQAARARGGSRVVARIAHDSLAAKGDGLVQAIANRTDGSRPHQVYAVVVRVFHRVECFVGEYDRHAVSPQARRIGSQETEYRNGCDRAGQTEGAKCTGC